PPLNSNQPGTPPFPAGLRFVFLRDGALWSVLADGSGSQPPRPERLTPSNVSVAPNWVVAPALPGRAAGDMLAYIDTNKGYIHIVRSDGLQDTTILQPLLKTASIQDTGTWATILSSLAWSTNGSMLAFVADPTGTGQTNL